MKKGKIVLFILLGIAVLAVSVRIAGRFASGQKTKTALFEGRFSAAQKGSGARGPSGGMPGGRGGFDNQAESVFPVNTATAVVGRIAEYIKVNGDVEAIETPIGFIPKYEDLKKLFAEIDKEYPKELYDKQFAFYLDNIIARIDLQEEAYGKEKDIPQKLFDVYEEQKKGLEVLKEKYGSIVSVEQLIEAAENK